jgi:hypothetical protein
VDYYDYFTADNRPINLTGYSKGTLIWGHGDLCGIAAVCAEHGLRFMCVAGEDARQLERDLAKYHW